MEWMMMPTLPGSFENRIDGERNRGYTFEFRFYSQFKIRNAKRGASDVSAHSWSDVRRTRNPREMEKGQRAWREMP